MSSLKRVVRFLDGGTGELLFHKGLPDDRMTWSARAILEKQYHSMVVDAHLDFMNAGSRIITTNNYAVIPGCLTQINEHENIEKYTKQSVQLAFKARNEFYKQHNFNADDDFQVSVAGSVPPLNESYRPDLLLSDKECNYWYSIIIKALYDSDVDIFLCETMSGFKEVQFALEVIKEHSYASNKKVWVSFCVRKDGLTRSKENINDIMQKLEPYFECNNVEMIGFNCSTPESISIALQSINQQSIALLEKYNIFVGCYANGYEYIADNWSLDTHEHTKTRKILTPKYYYQNFVKQWLKKYEFVQLIGGCCCMLPNHIKYIVDSVQNDINSIQSML